MQDLIYECEQWVPKTIEEIFPFFAEAKNLEKITPPHLRFHIVGMNTETINKGTLIDYKLQLYGVPFKWKTKISEFEPNKMFIDEQLKGPYSKWVHLHTFEQINGGTLLKDLVHYRIPMGALGKILLGRFIRKDIEKIFNYRKSVIAELFGDACEK